MGRVWIVGALLALGLLLSTTVLAGNKRDYGFHSSGRLEENEFHSLEYDALEQGTVDFSQFRNKVVLITNVASDCGYTQLNYEQLSALRREFSPDEFAVILIPSNDFGEQERGSDEEIATFIKEQGGDSYYVLSKSAMNGPEQHPLIEMLKQATNSAKRDITWNFETKFLVSKDGRRVSRYSEALEPMRLVESIRYLVKAEGIKEDL